MATTGPKYPTVADTSRTPPHSDNNWNDETNIYADDGNNASITAAQYDTDDQSYLLRAQGFDFSEIPDGATINGVTAVINTWYANGSVSIDYCHLLDTSGNPVGDNHCATPVALTTTDTDTVTEGGASDKWGNSLTDTWVKNANFGVALGFIATGDNADVFVDYVTLEIDYTESSGTDYTYPPDATGFGIAGALLAAAVIALSPVPSVGAPVEFSSGTTVSANLAEASTYEGGAFWDIEGGVSHVKGETVAEAVPWGPIESGDDTYTASLVTAEDYTYTGDVSGEFSAGAEIDADIIPPVGVSGEFSAGSDYGRVRTETGNVSGEFSAGADDSVGYDPTVGTTGEFSASSVLVFAPEVDGDGTGQFDVGDDTYTADIQTGTA
jgi:hypothetical protein